MKTHLVTGQEECVLCKNNHILYQCPDFNKLTVEEKYMKAKELRLCLNCFRKNHTVLYCKSSACCRKCGRKHHTLLHREQPSSHNEETKSNLNVSNTNATKSNDSNVTDSKQVALNTSVATKSHVLLSTALVQITDKVGNKRKAKALLDSGSRSCFISQLLQKS